MKKILTSFSLFIAISLISGASAFAQQPKKRPSPKPTVVVTQPNVAPTVITAKTQDGETPLTNAEVIRMTKAGFGETIILNAIQSGETRFDVSVNGLFALKNGGVSQKVIETMQFLAAGKQTTPTISETVTPTPSKNPTSENPLIKQSDIGDFSAMSKIGVVLIDGAKRVEMKLSQSNAKGSTLGAMVPFFGKAKIKSALNGRQAQLRITDTTPEFEIILASNINPTDQFALVKANQKSDRREIEVARASVVGGSSSGFRKEVVVPTTFEEIRSQTIPGGIKYILYRVKVVSPLSAGEYVFIPRAYSYYDFGVDATSTSIETTSSQMVSSSAVTSNTRPISDRESPISNGGKSVSAIPGMPTYGSISDIKGFSRIYVYAEDAESRERIIKELNKASSFQVVGNPDDAQILIEYKVLSRDSDMDKGTKDIRVKSQLSASYFSSGKRVVAWSDTAEFARLTSGGIGFRTQHNESKLTERFVKAMKN